MQLLEQSGDTEFAALLSAFPAGPLGSPHDLSSRMRWFNSPSRICSLYVKMDCIP